MQELEGPGTGPAKRLRREPVPRLLPPAPPVVQPALGETPRTLRDGLRRKRVPAREDGPDPDDDHNTDGNPGEPEQQPLAVGAGPVADEVRTRKGEPRADEEGKRKDDAVMHTDAVRLLVLADPGKRQRKRQNTARGHG